MDLCHRARVEMDLTKHFHYTTQSIIRDTMLRKRCAQQHEIVEGHEAIHGYLYGELGGKIIQWLERSSDSSKGNAAGEEQEEEVEEEEDDEVCFRLSATIHGGPVIHESSNRPKVSYERSVDKAKGKGIVGSSEGPKDTHR
ncbi:hypothetical protein PVK06_039885 [Gossypium arboreum]|uniref:Uncharacterized protein n=1 Tax=Gossypium arboreum TaxID=29729 RepID=A0ABR0N413_GOSAR|nr:hypothetical protein PVK06_039885 [Gossypium arboreum]